MKPRSKVGGRESKPTSSNLQRLTLAPRPTIEVAAGLVFRAGKILITQRHPDSHLGGLWEFPGGKREPGETFQQCLVRELQEELGIEVTVSRMLEDLAHDYPEKAVRLKFFHCRWQAREPQALGCAAFRWISADELADFDFPAADARLLTLLANSPALWR